MKKEAGNMANVRDPLRDQQWLVDMMLGTPEFFGKEEDGGQDQEESDQNFDEKFPLHQ